MASEIYPRTGHWNCSLKWLHLPRWKLLLAGGGGVEFGLFVHPCSALVCRDLVSELFGTLCLLGSMSLLVMIVLCSVLLRHET